jgi:hypothetical protein
MSELSETAKPDRSGRAAWLASAGAMAIFIALWVAQSGKPLQLDDVDHYGIARAIRETGKPLYYRGEDAARMSGALHPPLNDYLLAGWMVLWGESQPSAKAFSLAGCLAQGVAALALARLLLPPPLWRRTRPWFWATFLISPYSLQAASMVDIDVASYGPWLTLYLWSIVRLDWRSGQARPDRPRLLEWVLPAAVLTCCLWTKLTTVLLTFPFTFLLLVPRRGWGRAAATAAAIIAGGAGVFLATLWLAASSWGLSPTSTLTFAYRMATSGGHRATPIDTLVYMGPQLAAWTGLLPGFAAFAGLVCLGRGVRAERRSVEAAAAVVLGLAVASVLYYLATRLSFANAPYKYAFAYSAVLSLPLAVFAAGRTKVRFVWIGLAAAAGFGVAWFLLRDSVPFTGWNTRSLLLLGLPAGLGAAACLRAALGGKQPGWTNATLLLALSYHLASQAGVALVQATAPYSTTYDYGQRGLAEAARYVDEHTDDDDLISSMKDLGVLADRRYFESYAALYGGEDETDRLIKAWESGRVTLIVFTAGIGQDQLVAKPRLSAWLEHRAELVATRGNYRIYRPRTDETSPRRQTQSDAAAPPPGRL